VQVPVFIGEKHYPRAWLADLRLTLPAVPTPIELAEHVKQVMADTQIQDGVPLAVSWATLLVINGDVPVQQVDWSVDHAPSAEQLESRGYELRWAGTIPVSEAGFWGLALRTRIED
jgi:hypothetical protein